MNLTQLFLTRYDALYNFWLAVVWDVLDEPRSYSLVSPRRGDKRHRQLVGTGFLTQK